MHLSLIRRQAIRSTLQKNKPYNSLTPVPFRIGSFSTTPPEPLDSMGDRAKLENDQLRLEVEGLKEELHRQQLSSD